MRIRITPQQPIGFDLLVNGLGCRQTEAQWSFDYTPGRDSVTYYDTRSVCSARDTPFLRRHGLSKSRPGVYLHTHSAQREISGGTATTTARVVDGAVLVAAKLHSGRETDLRDVLAIAEEIDLDAVTPHLHRGDTDALRRQLERGVEILESDELRHGFRSDFGALTVPESTGSDLKAYLRMGAKNGDHAHIPVEVSPDTFSRERLAEKYQLLRRPVYLSAYLSPQSTPPRRSVPD